MFPSVLAIPEESLSPPGMERYAILATVDALDDEDPETNILETRRTGVDVNEVSTGAGKPRN